MVERSVVAVAILAVIALVLAVVALWRAFQSHCGSSHVGPDGPTGPVGFINMMSRQSLAEDQSLAIGVQNALFETLTKSLGDQIVYDSDSGVFTMNKAGTYSITASLRINTGDDPSRVYISKNESDAAPNRYGLSQGYPNDGVYQDVTSAANVDFSDGETFRIRVSATATGIIANSSVQATLSVVQIALKPWSDVGDSNSSCRIVRACRFAQQTSYSICSAPCLSLPVASLRC
jgi:hypothetical protein